MPLGPMCNHKRQGTGVTNAARPSPLLQWKSILQRDNGLCKFGSNKGTEDDDDDDDDGDGNRKGDMHESLRKEDDFSRSSRGLNARA